DGIRDFHVTGVQTCALPILMTPNNRSNSLYGYHGQALRVDVSTGEARTTRLEERILRRYLGGSGLGAYLLLREGTAELDSLDPRSEERRVGKECSRGQGPTQ